MQQKGSATSSVQKEEPKNEFKRSQFHKVRDFQQDLKSSNGTAPSDMLISCANYNEIYNQAPEIDSNEDHSDECGESRRRSLENAFKQSHTIGMEADKFRMSVS
jgi:hypothetical protein